MARPSRTKYTRIMFWLFISTSGMLAIGWLVWRALEKQGYATPPNDDEPPSA